MRAKVEHTQVVCPHCHRYIHMAISYLNVVVQCPHCFRVFQTEELENDVRTTHGNSDR